MLKEIVDLWRVTDYLVLLGFIQIYSKFTQIRSVSDLFQKSSLSAARVTVVSHCAEVFHPSLLGWGWALSSLLGGQRTGKQPPLQQIARIRGTETVQLTYPARSGLGREKKLGSIKSVLCGCSTHTHTHTHIYMEIHISY